MYIIKTSLLSLVVFFFFHSVAHLIPDRLIQPWGSWLYEMYDLAHKAKFTAQLQMEPSARNIRVPVVGVQKNDIADTFGLPRGNRKHEGIDIFASRGTYVLAATHGIVLRIGFGDLGGNYVFILGPGGERYYYAHLDEVDMALEQGQIIATSTIIGTVGTTGNAENTPPHLHFGIYKQGAHDPLNRLGEG